MATASDKQPKAEYLIFQDYEKGEYIWKDQFNNLINYIAGNINAYWNPNRYFYYNWYNESSQLLIVIRWRENNNFSPSGKYGSEFATCLIQKKEN